MLRPMKSLPTVSPPWWTLGLGRKRAIQVQVDALAPLTMNLRTDLDAHAVHVSVRDRITGQKVQLELPLDTWQQIARQLQGYRGVVDLRLRRQASEGEVRLNHFTEQPL